MSSEVTPRACAIRGCGRKVYARSLCSTHYHRALRGRPLDAPLRPDEPVERIARITLPARVVDALRRRDRVVARAARAVIEEWADGQR